MPRLSLWKETKSNDYRFFDKTIKEMFTVGATDLYIHKYIGSNNPVNTDATLPTYDSTDPTNIQDLLFLENRDRKYDTNIYRLRGHYNVQNLDFDLSQFGLFLTNDVIFITVHYNTMIDVIGRKLMVGDVFELPHLTDFHPLNETIPIGLRRYYQITDANFASEGFSSTWWPHLWRIKCEPLVDSQEFSDILNQPIEKDNYMGDWDMTKTYPAGYTVTYNGKIYITTQDTPVGTLPTDTNYWQLSTADNLRDIIGRYNKNIEINDANLTEAERLVPLSGYDRAHLYVVPTLESGIPAPPIGLLEENSSITTGMSLVSFVDSKYRNTSIGLRIPKSVGPTPSSPSKVTLNAVYAPPKLTDSGSGPVIGDIYIQSTFSLTSATGPYGTADNTYATSDEFVNSIITVAVDTPASSSVIELQTIPTFLEVGLPLSATLYSSIGIATNIFTPSAIISAINPITKTITVSDPTQGSMPAGTGIQIAFNFNGTITPEMDYLADCDPRFIYIKRSSPRDFGWLVGYLTGDDQAPNGEPVGSGIAFPANPQLGDYFLRLDYLPQKLFRFNGKMWVEISRKVRTPPTLQSDDQSQISTFINNTSTLTTAQGTQIPSRQSLSKALRITPD